MPDMIEMKTLTISEQQFEIVDEKARNTIVELSEEIDNKITATELSNAINQALEQVIEQSDNKYQPKGDYATKDDLLNYYTKTEIDTNTMNLLTDYYTKEEMDATFNNAFNLVYTKTDVDNLITNAITNALNSEV